RTWDRDCGVVYEAEVQFRNCSRTLPPTKCDGPIIFNMCTPTGSIESWVVAKCLRKPEFRVAEKSGWTDLWALGAKSRTKENIKMGNDNKRLKSKFIATMDPHGDEKKLEVRERHAEMATHNKEEKERRLQEKAMAEKEAREMHEVIVRIHREKKRSQQQEMQMLKKE
ncbi:hypothetical protein HOY80DRAFT_1113525, partial [Tuber brumale]